MPVFLLPLQGVLHALQSLFVADSASKPTSSRKKLPAVNLETIKALVAIHGARPTAKLTGLSHNTIRSWIHRHNWPLPEYLAKRGLVPRQAANTAKRGDKKQKSLQPICKLDPASAIQTSLTELKNKSQLNLAIYNSNTAEDLAKIDRKNLRLAVTRKAKDIADIHKTLFPPEAQQNQILNLAVLIGKDEPVKDERPVRATVIQAESAPDLQA